MTSARFCTSCGAPVVDGVCSSCRKKAVDVPGWDPAPAPVPEVPAAAGAPVGPPPGPDTSVGPPIGVAPAGPSAPLAVAPAGYLPAPGPSVPPVGYPVAPIGLPPPPPRTRRSHGGLIALLIVVLLAAGGGVWWWTHRSSGSGSGNHAPATAAPSTRAPSVAPVRTTRVVLGTVHADVPAAFVKVTAAPAGAVEYGNAATKPTEYFQLSRSKVTGAKQPSAYSAAELKKLGDSWQAQAVTSATTSSCPKPAVSGRTDAKKAGYVSTALTLTCKDAKGVVTLRQDRFLIPNDTLAYHGWVVAPATSWSKNGAALGAILPSMAPA